MKIRNSRSEVVSPVLPVTENTTKNQKTKRKTRRRKTEVVVPSSGDKFVASLGIRGYTAREVARHRKLTDRPALNAIVDLAKIADEFDKRFSK